MLNEARKYADYLEKTFQDYSTRNGFSATTFKSEVVDSGKFIRIESVSSGQRSIHSFIVKEDNSVKSAKSGFYFKKGDILKAASWKAPAKNFSRGNVFDPETYKNAYWTGP